MERRTTTMTMLTMTPTMTMRMTNDHDNDDDAKTIIFNLVDVNSTLQLKPRPLLSLIVSCSEHLQQ
jgi:hypothetical protein